MEFKKEDINDCLETASLITKKESPFPSFSNISFFPDGICAMNEISFLFHKTETGTEKTFGVAPELFNIVDKNKDDDLNLKLGKKFLSITSKSIKAKLSYTEEIERDMIPEIPEEFQELPLNFIEALGKTKFASSKEERQPEFFCFVVKKGNVYTTNGQIAAKAELEEEVEDMLFPVEFFPVLQTFAPTKYAIAKNWVFFNSGDSVVGVRQLEPSGLSDSIMEMFKDIQGDKVELPKGFKDIIEESGIFIDSEMGVGSINFDFKEGKMTLSSDNSKGEISKSVPFKKEIESFILSQKYLKAVAPIVDEFCNEKQFVCFFGDWVSVIIMKIQAS